MDINPHKGKHEFDWTKFEDEREVRMHFVIAISFCYLRFLVLIVEELFQELKETHLISLVGEFSLRNHDSLADVAISMDENVIGTLKLNS